MKKLLLILFVLLSIQGFACKCPNGGLKLSEYVTASDIAFKGKILSVERMGDFYYYEVKIEKLYKGELVEELIQIKSLATTSCKLRLLVDEEYFVFAVWESPGLYSVGTCSGTDLYDEKREVEFAVDGPDTLRQE